VFEFELACDVLYVWGHGMHAASIEAGKQVMAAMEIDRLPAGSWGLGTRYQFQWHSYLFELCACTVMLGPLLSSEVLNCYVCHRLIAYLGRAASSDCMLIICSSF